MTTDTSTSTHSAQGADSLLKNAKPLFLFGAARSGTTFLCRILNAHPQVLLTNESAVVLQLGELIRRSHIGASEGIVFGKSHNKAWSDVLRSESRQLIDRFYERVAYQDMEESGGTNKLAYYGDKHPHLFLCFDLLEEIYSDATYIHLVRDPRDAALSIAKMSNSTYQEGLKNWKIFDDHNRKFVQRVHEDSIFNLSYEELVESPHEVSQSVFEALGIKQDSEVARYLDEYGSVDAHTIQNRDGSTSLHSSNMALHPSTHQLGRWKKVLSREDCDFTDQLIPEALAEYGYPLCSEV
ncbi:unnamed protein product [Symbiodinium sp. CCMP2592]|nr:unnamed protein product [Symbiodinium sp. CCMP2592]